MLIREIRIGDNLQVERLIKSVLEEYGVPKVGSAYQDKALENMFLAYDRPKSVFFVIVETDKIIGCGGIAPLDNYEGNVCELQKMYLGKAARGRGLGYKMIAVCLNKAKEFKFEGCYLETMPNMDAAQKLYLKNGFEYIDSPMGCTGHTSCPVYMFKKLSEEVSP